MRRTSATLLLCLVCSGSLGAFAAVAGAAPSIESASVSVSTIQAGAHPGLNASVVLEEAGDPETARNLRLGLPAGFFLYPDTGPRCSAVAFDGGACPITTQVGVVAMTGGYEGDPDHEFGPAPLYLIAPQAGQLARLGFVIPALGVPVMAQVTVRGADRGLDLEFGSFPQTNPLTGIEATVWGVPAAPVHDAERGGPSNAAATPFTRNPTSCGAPGSLEVKAESWQDPGVFATEARPAPPIAGCDKLAFSPSFGAALTSAETSAPAGLELSFEAPSILSPGGLSAADARTLEVTLPAELALDEEMLDGLTACSPAQAHLEGGPNECPPAAEIGSIQASVAGVEASLEGSVYFGGAESPGSYRLFLIASGGGVDLRQQATLAYDESSEAWGVDLPNLPQLPIDAFDIQVGGAGGPFSTPWECGSFEAAADFTPWSESTPIHLIKGLEIETGPEGGPCPGPAEEVVVVLDPPSLAADGVSTTTATATVTDANGYLVSGDEVVFESTDPEQQIGPVTDKDDGTYTVQITASTTPGTSVILASDESVEAGVFGFAELTQTAVAAPPLLPAATPPPPSPLPLSPRVKLRGRPAQKTHDRAPIFSFASSVPGSSFQCKIDKRQLRSCKSPLTLRRLSYGRHAFKVRAIAPNGLKSAFATYSFVVQRRMTWP